MAGELITVDWQAEWAGTLFGAGTPFVFAEPGIGGLGVPDPHTADVPLDLGDGVWLGHDWAGTRVVTIPFVLTGDTPAEAANLLVTLSGLWAPTPTSGELHLRLPGFGHVWVTGRPRGLAENLALLRVGVIEAFATFFCGDPTLHQAA